MIDISGIGKFVTIEPVEKGWSEDRKYCVTRADGSKCLLRITPIERYEIRKALYEMLERISELGVPMCVPLGFGTCLDGVYSLQSWINGDDLEAVLPLLPEAEQYVLGLKSGEILKKMHTIPAPNSQEGWASRFNNKTNIKVQKYRECGLRFDGDDHVIEYIEKNRGLLENRPQCFQHGDYHVGNMMIEHGVEPLDKALKIIDFDRFDYGDPWEEFNRIVWSAAASPYFSTGQLRGYFGGEPPIEFFKLLAFYISSNTLSSIYWAIPFGQSDIDTMIRQSQDVLRWFDNMKNPIPTWYLKDLYIQYIDGIPFKLKSPFDFSFIRRYGTVFKVFDDQDGGNICFGVKAEDGRRYFVKFAGAPTEGYDGNADDAIMRLKPVVQIYRELAHPLLIKFVCAEEVGGGYAVVFEWADAVCAMRMYPQDYPIFKAIPLDKKIMIFEDIMEFHAHVAERGYVAIDFYDGSIMYDLANERTVICDIDFYEKSPYVGSMGLWGSTRFVSPEERTDGAVLDEVTNVYTMGATAFCLFADSDRTPEKWPLSEQLYDVVKRAVSDERDKRQQSIRQLIAEWRAAKFVMKIVDLARNQTARRTQTQNIYDNPVFFDGYKKLRENPDNANLLEEKPALFSLAPDLVSKTVLDLGCGYGENCTEFKRLGAVNVLGIDISEKMLSVARVETSDIEYLRADMNDMSDVPGRYDAVFSSLAVHYVVDFNRLCAQIAGLLYDGGYFIFSQEHPLTTAPVKGVSWTKDENGRRIHYNLSDYAKTGKREMTWIVDGVVKYHRTFSEIINALISNGFIVEKMLEPIPDEETIKRLPSCESELHKPNFLLIRARKERTTE